MSMDATTINDARDEYLLLLDQYPQGANGEERRTIRERSGHQWTAGMVMSDGDLVGGHLLEWVDAERGDAGRLKLTNEGRFWAAAKRAAVEQGLTVKEYVATRLATL